MTRTITFLFVGLLTLCFTIPSADAKEYQFGDHKSSTLTGKAWRALNQDNFEDAIVYTKKCIELYQGAAKDMQDSLEDYAQGTDKEIHAYWALNDVATSLFIQAKALIAMDKTEQAEAVIQNLMDNFNFGQCWDPNGWFWKPAEAAAELL